MCVDETSRENVHVLRSAIDHGEQNLCSDLRGPYAVLSHEMLALPNCLKVSIFLPFKPRTPCISLSAHWYFPLHTKRSPSSSDRNTTEHRRCCRTLVARNKSTQAKFLRYMRFAKSIVQALPEDLVSRVSSHLALLDKYRRGSTLGRRAKTNDIREAVPSALRHQRQHGNRVGTRQARRGAC